MSNYILIAVSTILLILSFLKSKEKTKLALKKSYISLKNILPELISIVLVVGIILAFTSPSFISKVLGEDSGIFGILIAAIAGSITLIPGFVAFPVAKMVLVSGAGISQVAVFLSTLMMVGIITIPLEIKYFGKELTFKRNIFAFILAVIIGLIMGVIIR